MRGCHGFSFFAVMDTAGFTRPPASQDHPFCPLYVQPGPDTVITHRWALGHNLSSPAMVFYAGNDEGEHSF